MKLVVTADAEADLTAIGEYIARDDPDGSAEFVEALLNQCARIVERPLAYRLRNEWGLTIRAKRHGSHLILFEIDGEAVVILRVLHGRQDILAILTDKP